MAKIQNSSVHKLPSEIISYNESGTATILAFYDYTHIKKKHRVDGLTWSRLTQCRFNNTALPTFQSNRLNAFFKKVKKYSGTEVLSCSSVHYYEKVKVTPEQATNTQRGSRGIDLLFL